MLNSTKESNKQRTPRRSKSREQQQEQEQRKRKQREREREFCAPPRANPKAFKIILEMDMTSTAEAAARSWYDSPRLGGDGGGGAGGGGGGGGSGSPHANGLGSAGSSLAHSHHSLSSGASSAGSSVGAALGGAGVAGGAGAGLGLDTSDMSAFYALESNGHHRRYYPSYHQHSEYPTPNPCFLNPTRNRGLCFMYCLSNFSGAPRLYLS